MAATLSHGAHARTAPLSVSAATLVCAAGRGRTAVLAALRERRTGLTRNAFTSVPLETWIGRVPGIEEEPWPQSLAQWECRNNRLAWAALCADDFRERVARARARYGAERIAVVVGTSTASVGATEEAYCRLEPDGQYPPDLRRPVIHTPHSLAGFAQEALALRGLAVTVATACSSSAKVFAEAARLMALGFADAAVVGGADSLCGNVLFGFHSLALLSANPCRPFDPGRDGISLGEGAGFALLEPEGPGPWLLGYGESSDAHHMSAPHPQGLGARRAIARALERAGLPAECIEYINLHGTASQKNDEIEARVVAELFPPGTRASSTKGWTGHALGAAGILEAVITLISLETGFVPGTLNARALDPVCGPQLTLVGEERSLRYASSHSFGFGGSNCVLLFGRERPR